MCFEVCFFSEFIVLASNASEKNVRVLLLLDTGIAINWLNGTD